MERIYYTDPYRTEFEATVDHVEHEAGRLVALLDQTAFYPESGGQPSDTGTLNDARVIEAVEREDGSIAHVLDRELAAGSTVRGVVDWNRRFDHMQQHTGQHILSSAFDRLHGARTVGFHLGGVVSTLDLSRTVSADEIAAAEAEANRIVWENRRVSIRFATDEEAAALPLRKEPERAGLLRLIEIERFDLSACGGTHVACTGEIGLVGVLSWERFRGGSRLEFVCGSRTLGSFRTFRDAVRGAIRVLSVLPGELPDAVERVQAESRDLRRTLIGLQERLAGHEACALAARAQASGGRLQVLEAVDGWDANGLKALAAAVVRRPGHDVVLMSNAAPFRVVVARSAEGTLDAAAVLNTLTSRFGGRGGGKPDLAQGGGLEGSVAEILSAARQALSQ